MDHSLNAPPTNEGKKQAGAQVLSINGMGLLGTGAERNSKRRLSTGIALSRNGTSAERRHSTGSTASTVSSAVRSLAASKDTDSSSESLLGAADEHSTSTEESSDTLHEVLPKTIPGLKKGLDLVLLASYALVIQSFVRGCLQQRPNDHDLAVRKIQAQEVVPKTIPGLKKGLDLVLVNNSASSAAQKIQALLRGWLVRSTRKTSNVSSDEKQVRCAASGPILPLNTGTSHGDLSLSNEAVICRIFDEIDTLGRKRIQLEDIAFYLLDAASRMNIQLRENSLDLALEALVEDVDHYERGISRDAFIDIFRRRPAFALRQRNVKRILDQEVEQEQRFENHFEAKQKTKIQWNRQRRWVAWVIMYATACTVSLVVPALRWAENEEATAVFGSCIVVARSSANALNLHAALVLLPIARHALTWLQLTPFRYFLFPIEASIEFHVLIGISFALLTMAHVLAHVCDYVRFVDADADDIVELVGTKLGPLPSSKLGRWGFLLKQRASVTGLAMLLCLFVVFLVIRQRRSNFNRFWWCHQLFLLMLILMCIHGSGCILQDYRTLYWVAFPLALYALPRIYREVKCTSARIEKAEIHGDVLALQLARPKGWGCVQRSGMYAYLNVPSIARTEWHPCSLTSAPEEDHISFHIRKVGDWTKKVHAVFKTPGSTPRIRIEGPIGSPSQEFLDYEVVVLAGGGIGITPMISVIQQLLRNRTILKKAFFYWIARDNESFEWFATQLSEVFEQDPLGCLEIRTFVTNVSYDDADLGQVLFRYAADTVHANMSVDIVLGHRTHTQAHFGRPNWDDELQHVVQMSRQMGCFNCGIFHCGPDGMAQDVRATSDRLSKQNVDVDLHFIQETF